MEVHTYIEVSSTVKAILIGHHTEREGERRQERKGRRQHKGTVVERQKKKENKKKRCGAPPCGRRAEQQVGVTMEGEARKKCQTDREREKRKESEIITHRAPCKAKYHLFVWRHKDWSTH